MSLLVCYPGSPGTTLDFNPLARALPQHKVENRMRDLTIPTERFISIGYSLGAWWAMEMAQKFNLCDGCILIAPYVNVKETAPVSTSRFKTTAIQWITKNPIAAKLIVRNFIARTSSPAQPTAEYLSLIPDLIVTLPSAVTEKSSRIYPRELLQARPMLVVAGQGDTVTSINDMRSQFTGQFVTLNEIPNAGHALMWTHTRTLVQHIEAFLNKQNIHHKKQEAQND